MRQSRRLVLSTSVMIAAVGAVWAGGPDSATPRGPTSEQAIKFLREGNARFASDEVDHPNSSAERRAAVSGGQKPFAVILSCADSRVPVELLFDRGIGDLFVVRVAGNVADQDEIGTIEYGVGHLGAPLVLVLGHTACGAVKAVASGAEVHGSIPGLVDNIIPAVEWVKKNRPGLSEEELVNAAIEANVWQSIDDLITRSEEVRGLLSANRLQIVGGVYDLASGRVRFLGEHPYQSKLMESSSSGQGQAQADHANVPHHGAHASGSDHSDHHGDSEGHAEKHAPTKTTNAPTSDDHDHGGSPHR